MNKALSTTKVLGAWGEQIACQYLQDKGYKILDVNFRNKIGEIDIVAQDGKMVCFVEVKTRQSLQCGHGHESVHPWKMRKMGQLAQSYLKFKYHTVDIWARFDVVSIYQDHLSQPQIEHIKNAFDLT